MSETLDLGQLCLSLSKANLKLISQGSITASLQNTASTDLTSLSSVLTERSGWVRRGLGLHLALDICVDAKPLNCQQSHRVANSICSAELWKQLHLQPTLPLDLREEPNSIRINLSHTDVDCPSQEKSRHRLAVGASIADVQPPDGVHVVRLEQVKLKIDITTTPQCRVQRKKDRGATRRIERSQPEVGEAPASDMDLICMDEICEEKDFEILSDDSMLLDLPEDRTLTDLPETIVSSHYWKSTSKTTRVDSGISMEPHDEQVDGVLSSETIASLIDTAIYCSICEKAPKQKGGIKVKSDDMKMKLASIAPSLWSPGFLKTISERAPFVPPIAHTLSSPLLMQAKSSSLRDKLTELHKLRHETSFHSVSISLWDLLQRELYDPGAARRIRPLKTENVHSVGTLDDDDLLPEYWNDSMKDGNEDHGFENLEHAGSEYEAFLGIEDDDEDNESGLLHDPDFSDEMIVDSAYNVPLQASFASMEHEDEFLPGMLHDSPDFDDFFEDEGLEDLL
ncbi:hypothetical protein BKA81DRAFT_361647 [Phyllosticta paracitricarpa]|uniref:Uncharacterized protein n=1 Tax=Phyllosticta citricarpa TaxID=55181 RepID=A0ABR1MPV5_9PEZI